MDIRKKIKSLSEKYIRYSENNALKEIELTLRTHIEQFPKDCEMLTRLAISIFSQMNGCEEDAIELLRRIPPASPWHYKATLIEAYVEEELRIVNENMLKRLMMLQSTNNELESMKYYMASSYFLHKSEKSYQATLEKSVALCNKHVWNLINLARAYQATNAIACKMLLCKALDNVEFIGSDHKPDEDVTDIDYFIKSHISGLYLTTSQLRLIINDLRPIPRKMPWEK